MGSRESPVARQACGPRMEKVISIGDQVNAKDEGKVKREKSSVGGMAFFGTAQGRTYNLSFLGLREVGIGIGGKIGDGELRF